MTESTRIGSDGSDALRQVVVFLSLIIAILGSAIGSGVLGGTPIAEAAGGALSADATLIAPAGPAFSIWSIIYLGLVAYTVWQLLPAQKASGRQRRLGYPMAASLALNAGWILSVQAGFLGLSVIVIVVLLVVLAYAFRLVVESRPGSWVEAIAADGVVGLYLGWVCVATAANIAAALVAAGFTGWGIDADAWGATVVALAGLAGVALAIGGRGRIGPALSISWGLSWVAVGRLSGAPDSVPTAVAAIVAVCVVLLVTLVVRLSATNTAKTTLRWAPPGSNRRPAD